MIKPDPICSDCLRKLTPKERYYYESRCEKCEEEKTERISRWLSGGSDTELDEKFSSKKSVKH